ncbi:MAG: TonB-dependent receptor [Sediminibacterium magnilacihabitans]|jgi:hypothetical protein|nr:TonB-dependent receptor [Sediminibacterium magnilacihabitans]PQV59769.1 hypothetical protein CLV53_11482 [Sediminibacterium magnilacihabitans]
MLKYLLFLAACLLWGNLRAQKKPVDTLGMMSVQVNDADAMPVLLMDETEGKQSGPSYMAPLLTAARDPFYAAATFQFSAFRFRIRGYEGHYFQTTINGLSMNTLEDGNTPWSLWSGLNDVFRNAEVVAGLRNSDHVFGGIGGSLAMNIRAASQRRRMQFSYGMSNRSYTHRWMFTYHSGMQKNGWAFSFSGSRRWADEGHAPGSFYDGWSYFMGIDKKLSEHQSLSLSFFGSPLQYGRQAAILMESIALLGTTRYNPYWGYQGSRKRNANTSIAHQPVLLLTHEMKLNHHINWLNSFAWISGCRSSTGLDWYKAADPRPDYYRYLPSFQSDSSLRVLTADAIREQVSLQQINWEKLYQANRESVETISDVNGVTGRNVQGLRSRYIIEERMNAQQRIHFSSLLAMEASERLMLKGGIQLQYQAQHHYKKLNDLLGGEFYVNWNQFAERDAIQNADAIQYDLDQPNRIIRKGDVFGYDYSLFSRSGTAWMQASFTGNKIDGFAAVSLTHTAYQREGHVRNGLFPGASFGKSDLVTFNTHAVKAGCTYKLDGRRYFFLHAALLTRAPLAADLFISPRTRDTRQDVPVNEQVQSAEAGYAWNTPLIRFRLTSYITRSQNGLDLLSFYHDEYKSFVNYAINNIGKLYYGVEIGGEAQLNTNWSLAIAVSLGRHYYNSRQQVSVSLDNDDYIVAKEEIYIRNFRLPGSPQEAYHTELRYQSSRSFFFNLAANYSRQRWLDMNPFRRTYTALQGITEQSEQWNKIIGQTVLPPALIMNLFTGKSWLLRTAQKGKYRTLQGYISVSNLLNQVFITGGYEQLRFDMTEKDADRFPPKFYFNQGVLFSAGLSFRL